MSLFTDFLIQNGINAASVELVGGKIVGYVSARVKVVVASFMRPRAQYRFALSAL
jgi:hypothetical protein